MHADLKRAAARRSERSVQPEQVQSCRSEEGITVGLVDALIGILRVLAPRDLRPKNVRDALTDLFEDSDFRTVAGHRTGREEMHIALKRAAARQSERTQAAFREGEHEVRYLTRITSGRSFQGERPFRVERSEHPELWAALYSERSYNRNSVHARIRGEHA